VNLEELVRECSALNENLNAIREVCDTLQRDRNNLVYSGQRDNAVGELSSIQEPHMLLTQESDTSRSEYEELKIKYNELNRECSALKDNLNAIIEERDALQRDRDNW
jgi:flagellar biosynthesis chaperone FliJ